MIEDTVGRLFLFAPKHTPRVFVCTDGGIAMPETLFGLQVHYFLPPWRYNDVHAMLHRILRNGCRGKINTVTRRNNQDSVFSNLVRMGPDGKGGCYDTPFIDIDALRRDEGGAVVSVIECKRPREGASPYQRRILDWLKDNGGEVEWLIT